jgi:WD40 repeat protein
VAIAARACWPAAKQAVWPNAVALGRVGDREVVAAGSNDGMVRLWDAVSGSEIAVLRAQGGRVTSVALGHAGGREIVLSIASDRAVRVIDLDSMTLEIGRTLILGPGPRTLLDLRPDGESGYRLGRLSDDAWRYWRAQGFVDGRLVNFSIDDMPRAV